MARAFDDPFYFGLNEIVAPQADQILPQQDVFYEAPGRSHNIPNGTI